MASLVENYAKNAKIDSINKTTAERRLVALDPLVFPFIGPNEVEACACARYRQGHWIAWVLVMRNKKLFP